MEAEQSGSETIPNSLYVSSVSNHLDYIGIYAILIGVLLALSLPRSFKLFMDLLDSSNAIHSRLVRAIVRVPMRFIEVNTVGKFWTVECTYDNKILICVSCL